jgi:quercetin dioxygenase-like cupin family protein
MNAEQGPEACTANDPQASPGQARAIKRRLLERVADADASHLTIAAADGVWQPFTPGVARKLLHQEAGVMSYLLRLDPGARLPPHRHPIDEECIVIEGRLHVGTHTEIGPGAYHRAGRGALHPSIVAPAGATVFLRGAVPEADDVLR